jgi:hypothetical protein
MRSSLVCLLILPLCIVGSVSASSVSAPTDSPPWLVMGAKKSQHCKLESITSKDGKKVWDVNCGLGATCPDGTSCCRLGGNVECCKAGEKCNSGVCE